MSTLREPFGTRSEEVWGKLKAALQDKDALQPGNKLVANAGDWVVTLDLHSEAGYRSEHHYTRFRAPFVNPEGFRFTVSNQTVFDHIGKLAGMQDIEVGHEPFDKRFLVQGNDPAKIKALFDDDRLRELIKLEPEINILVRDAGNWFQDYYPDNVDELVVEVLGKVEDPDRLKRLYELFSRLMDGLCKVGSAYGA